MGSGNHCDISARAVTALGRIAAACLLTAVVALGIAGCSVGRTYTVGPETDLADIVDRLEPGDTLLLEPGTYTQTLELAGLHGTAGHEITIAAAGSDADSDAGAEGSAGSPAAVTFDGGGLPNGSTMIAIDHCSYLRISDLAIAHAHGEDACGISVTPGCGHLTLDHNEFYDIRATEAGSADGAGGAEAAAETGGAGAGAGTGESTGGPSANCILLLGDSAREAISDVEIRANTFHGCDTGWSECVSVSGHAARVTVEDNTIDDTGNIGIDFSGNYGYCPDPALDRPVDCVARGNTVRNCRAPYATSYGIYADGAQDVVIEDNTVTDCSGGIEVGAEQPQASADYAASRIRVEGNTIADCDEAALTIGGYAEDLGWVTDVDITGNTCTNNGRQAEDAIIKLSKCEGVRITHNAFRNEGGAVDLVRYELGHGLARDVTLADNICDGV
ncbi:MAG: right-handed parallel beta-helix repeat-containing protein [Olegusella sp.]|nr:right-handed parallel beta-helix repeat-containing protein [Olegusella sp.]